MRYFPSLQPTKEMKLTLYGEINETYTFLWPPVSGHHLNYYSVNSTPRHATTQCVRDSQLFLPISDKSSSRSNLWPLINFPNFSLVNINTLTFYSCKFNSFFMVRLCHNFMLYWYLSRVIRLHRFGKIRGVQKYTVVIFCTWQSNSLTLPHHTVSPYQHLFITWQK